MNLVISTYTCTSMTEQVKHARGTWLFYLSYTLKSFPLRKMHGQDFNTGAACSTYTQLVLEPGLPDEV